MEEWRAEAKGSGQRAKGERLGAKGEGQKSEIRCQMSGVSHED